MSEKGTSAKPNAYPVLMREHSRIANAEPEGKRLGFTEFALLVHLGAVSRPVLPVTTPYFLATLSFQALDLAQVSVIYLKLPNNYRRYAFSSETSRSTVVHGSQSDRLESAPKHSSNSRLLFLANSIAWATSPCLVTSS